MKGKVIVCFVFALIGFSCAGPNVEWVSTTENSQWDAQPEIKAVKIPSPDVIIETTKVNQTIDGFGTCFNELGWTSLEVLDTQVREGIMRELFSPGAGANLTICRMPVAANDFARDWYSYNETEGDFTMENFSIANDEETLIPFIKNALKYNPDLNIWASPWSPPSWMKYNKHYAERSTAVRMVRPPITVQTGSGQNIVPGQGGVAALRTISRPRVDNGLSGDPSLQGHEGQDSFIQEEAYYKAYALYFGKFIDSYKAAGIDIFAVMPQNEFNSAQIFPSCCWSPGGLSRFISYLGPEMEQRGVDVMFGTLERANEALFDTTMLNPASSKYIKGVGFQWAGKDALPGIYNRYPDLKLYQTEQECGNGRNDWSGALHSWELMKHYLNNGVNAYMYWNTSLLEGGVSRWGWAQNSLVVVDEENRSFEYTLEYYLLKHASHYVKPGARKLGTTGGYDDLLAFLNPDNSIVVIMANQEDEDKAVSFMVNNRGYEPLLRANSFNTFLFD